MSGGKLLILGAGIYQVPLIQKARDMGLFTVVVSIPGEYPGIPLADRFVPLDTRDREAILELAVQERIDGICTSGTDVAVRTVGYVCDHLGLPGVSGESAELVTDKLLMKEALRAGGVSTARFCRVRTMDEAAEAAEKLGYPVVMKAPDSSGSRGILRADSGEELEEAFRQSMAVSGKEYVLAEEFIRGVEIGVDGYVGECGIEDFYPHGKYTYTAAGATMPVGHSFPWEGSEAFRRKLRSEMELAVRALRMKNCPFNADVFVDEDRIWIIEVGGRTGATCIPELLTIHTGRNWYELIIRAALGEKMTIGDIPGTRCSAKLIFSPVDGIIEEIDREGLARLGAEGVDWRLDYGAGHRVDAMRNGTDRIGHLVAAADTEEQLEEYLSRMRSCIRLDRGNLEEIWRKRFCEDRF